MSRTRLEPSAEHPITVEPSTQRVTVSVSGRTIATTGHALVLREASYPPVYYVPEADVDASLLTPSDTQTYCPFKGDASYVSVEGEDGPVADVAWTYREPYDAVADIAGHFAFYPSKVDVQVA